MNNKIINEKLNAYTGVVISPDLKSIPDNQKQIIEYLIAAGKIADEIFWQQSSHDSITIRDQYKNQPGPLKD